MAGPWEKYQAQPAATAAGAGPWSKYAAPQAAPDLAATTEAKLAAGANLGDLSPEELATVQSRTAPAPAPMTGPQAVEGGVETGLAMATGATGGALGMLGGTLAGLAESILSGKFGTQEASDLVAKRAEQGAAALTYAPRSAAGQQMTQAVGDVMMQAAVPLGPAAAEVAATVGTAGRALAPVAVGQVQRVAQTAAATPAVAAVQRVAGRAVEPLARVAGEMGATLRNEPLPPAATAGARQNMGAALTPAQAQRVATAEGLPVPVTLTRGAATRDAAALAFEKEQMKSPDMGAPLRARAEQNNLQILQNLDQFIDETGAVAVRAGMPDVGRTVTGALLQGYEAAKNRTRAAYQRAFQSPGAQDVVDLTRTVTVMEDGAPVTGTVFEYLNSRPSGLPSTAVPDAARRYAVNLGVATMDETGQLVPNPSATVAQLEKWRKEISGSVGNEPQDRRYATILKNGIDETMGEAGGDAFRAARATRRAQARKYENRAVVARLVETVANREDPKVMSNEVFGKAIATSSPEEITFLKRVLQTSGKNGQQAWRELQGATVRDIYDTAVKGGGMDSEGNPIVSVAQLNQRITQLDNAGRLEAVFGKQKAAQIRDLNEVARYVSTVPPGTLVNNSGTAGTIMAALAEAGAAGALTGVPVPIASGLRLLSKHVKDQRIKARIEKTLNARGE